MEPQATMPQNTAFFQEYQAVYNAADLSGQFSRLRIHGLFLASKNADVKKRGDLKKTKLISCSGCYETAASGPAVVRKLEPARISKRKEQDGVPTFLFSLNMLLVWGSVTLVFPDGDHNG
jgi:hypothetical protein